MPRWAAVAKGDAVFVVWDRPNAASGIARFAQALAPLSVALLLWALLADALVAVRVAACGGVLGLLLVVRHGRGPWVTYAVVASASLTGLLAARTPGVSPGVRAFLWISFLVAAAALMFLLLRLKRLSVLAGATGAPVHDPTRAAQSVGVLAVLVTLTASMMDLPPSARAAQWLSVAAVGAVVTYLVARLRAQAALLHEVDDLKSRFVALTNHELRTPVAVLHSVLETLEEDLAGKLTTQQAAFLRAACASSRELADRVDMLTQLHRLQVGPETDGRRLPFGEVYQEVAREVGRSRNGVSLRATMSEQAEAMPVPSADTALVLRQLLANAFKFSPMGGDVEVRAQIAGNELVWDVADHGPGVPLAQRSAIFEAFYQPGDLLRRHNGGMGVGLNLARLACRRMGATVAVCNRPGGGACFTVRMPVAVAATIPFPVSASRRLPA